MINQLTTTWEDVQDESNLKTGDPFEPPFEWNIKNIDEPDKMSEPASLEVAAKESDGPAGVEDTVICNRHVDITFGATMDDFHKVSKLAAGEDGGSLEIDMTPGVFTLNVGKEATSEEDEEEEEEEGDDDDDDE